MKPNLLILSTLRILIFPFSLLFGSIAVLRRILFRPTTFVTPTICVGNLRVGGVGKTPHVEYIAKFLSQHHQIAILSRGYGRKTKGYLLLGEQKNLNSEIVGDEPMQYVSKFPNVAVAVCEKRKTGIENLLQNNPKLEAVVLDDAFQHLGVNYSLRILLTEYERPFFEDFPLPAGNLREFRCASQHADIIIVTKCPDTITDIDKSLFQQKLKLKRNQELFFTKITYQISNLKSQILNSKSQILISGISNPIPLVHYLKAQTNHIHHLRFPDHHTFTNKDIEKIIRLKEKLGGDNCAILTTEKDAARLQAFENMPEFVTLPIEIVFLEKEEIFKEKLLSLLIHDDA